MTPDMTRALVRGILARPLDTEWSIQGLGMLRTYLTDQFRLHVWSTADATPNVSRLHDHPWGFVSYVVAGHITNYRYRLLSDEIDPNNPPEFVETWRRVRIRCGPNGGTVSAPDLVHLMRCPVEKIAAGQWYSQHASEVHDTNPADGTVSIIRRTPLPDPDHANVYFPVGTEWVSAGGAQSADPEIVKRVCDNALERWF